jgi:predicted permease
MSFIARIRSAFQNLFRRTRKDQELDAEVRGYVDLLTDEKMRAGVKPEEARRAARLELGGVEQVKENVREVRAGAWLDSLLQDLRYGARMLRKNLGFTAIAVLTLALGIGANTAIFSLIDTLMLHRLPVQDPGQLVELLNSYPGDGRWNGFSSQSYEHFRDYNHVFSGLIATAASPFQREPSFYLRGAGLKPERVPGVYVTPNFFPVLGVKPTLGRLIGPEDDHISERAAVAVVSWSYWRNRFNLDPRIIGKQIVVEDVPVTIVGIAPRGFFGLQEGSRQDIWLPLAIEPLMHSGPSFTSSHYGWLKLMGRLKPDVSVEQARAEVRVLYEWTIEDSAKFADDASLRAMKVELEPAAAGFSHFRDQFAKPLLLLMAVVGLLLLIACANVASLLLARGAARRRELAVRVCMGAGRLRLVRQMLTESLLLSGLGSLLGILLAYFCTGALVRIISSGRERIELYVRPDTTVLLFTAAVGLLTGLLFGLAPALRAWRIGPGPSLRQAGKASETSVQQFLGKSLVVAQVALSVVLLAAAGMFVRQLSNLKHLDLGFRRDHILLVTLDPSYSGYDADALLRAYRELLERFEVIPGVQSATLCGATPIDGAGASSQASVEGHQSRIGESRFISENWIAPKYFETVGTPLLAGRDFTMQDDSGPRVAVINQTMSRYYFDDRNPIGKHVTLDGDDKPYEIVGVVGDLKLREIRENAPRTIYFSAFQDWRWWSQFALRTTTDPSTLVPEVRRTIRESLKTVPVTRVTTMADQIDASIVSDRLIATLSGWFGTLGALFAAIGLYGLLAYIVGRRTNEIGIRMALGATRSNVTRMVLREALAMVCAGLAIGILLAFWGKRIATGIVPDLPGKTSGSIIFGVATMFAVALLAALVPAWRAARVDPMEALRHE